MTVDLLAPFTTDTLLEVRSGRMQLMKGLKIKSGINKSIVAGPVKVGPNGILDDEHDPTFHGGPDKAILGYCSSHYPSWQEEFPSAASKFRPGGFGENFVTEKMNERNVCIGDVIAVGPDVVLQVSLPRQPCFKLNHRFELKNFAPNTWRLSRTGWYYRVLREGSVQAGDELRLVDRPNPDWTVERVQEFLHRNPADHAANAALAAVDALGEESRGAFRKRVAKQAAAERRANAAAAKGGVVVDDDDDAAAWRDFRIARKTVETPRVVSLLLQPVAAAADRAAGPAALGMHAKLRLPSAVPGGPPLVRAYSVVGGDGVSELELGVALAAGGGRGGSRYLHSAAASVGSVVQVGRVTSDVQFAEAASSHVFVAGGVGITAFLPMLEVYERIHYDWTLHWAVRDADTDVPFRARVEALPAHRVVLYNGKAKTRMDVPAVVAALPWNGHLYVCGPPRVMEEARVAADKAGLRVGEDVHYEAFAADVAGDPFEVVVRGRELPAEAADKACDGALKVGEEETLLEVLRRYFDDVPSSCEVGNCGTCKVALVKGKVEHRGTALTDEEKADSLLACVSRGIGRITVEF